MSLGGPPMVFRGFMCRLELGEPAMSARGPPVSTRGHLVSIRGPPVSTRGHTVSIKGPPVSA